MAAEMRHPRVLSGLNAAIEDFGFALGEAQDFIEREELNFCDLVDDVAFGKLSSREAKQRIHLAFDQARRDVGQWRRLRADAAEEGGFPYLHESLRVGRVVVDLPIPEGAA